MMDHHVCIFKKWLKHDYFCNHALIIFVIKFYEGKGVLFIFTELKKQVYGANMLLPDYKLVTFTWGKDAAEAVHNAVVLEEVAMMALHTKLLSPNVKPISEVLMTKYFMRKHGENAYYGQK